MSDIKSKISKILEKANSTTHEGEAAALIAKAEALMAKHQIEAFELGDNSDPVGMTQGVQAQSGPIAYKSHLQLALAKYYGCRAIRKMQDRRIWIVELVGAESARITTELMTDFVWQQCNAEARKIAKAEGIKPGPVQRRIINALCARIYDLVADRQETTPKTKIAQKNALVQVDAIEAWITKHYPNLSSSKGGRRSTSEQAKKAAAGISLHRQTGGAAQKRIA